MNEFYTYTGRLPHWRQEGSVYFVTWRLYKQQPPLCNEERDLIEASLNHFQGQRYELLAYVVMDDHIHVIAALMPGYELQAVLHTWKSFTANRLQREYGRTGLVWQKESFDRIVRDPAEFEEKRLYIMKNAFKRWPEITSYKWMFPQP